MIYEYFCKIHGVFEVQQSINDPSLKNCPKCFQSGLMEHCCKSCHFLWRFPVSETETFDVDTNKIKCMDCNSTNVESYFLIPKKIISLSSFQLKGGCWAKDKYSK